MMGKARGPKRKEAPARKRLQAGNSGLLHKQTHRNQNGGAHRAAGLDGEAKRVGEWEEWATVVDRDNSSQDSIRLSYCPHAGYPFLGASVPVGVVQLVILYSLCRTWY